MDTKQEFTLKRSGASDTFDSEDEDSSSTCKKSKLSRIINEDKNQKFSSQTIVDSRKDGLSPTPKKVSISFIFRLLLSISQFLLILRAKLPTHRQFFSKSSFFGHTMHYFFQIYTRLNTCSSLLIFQS